MATTTPNFGWPVPTSTDLVKDGATAIEALGDGVDASLVDLKGGTTGQVLAKTSGTDLDFTWVTTDDTNAIQNAIVDAKGDLIAASAADTPARLAVGNNGETLIADSTAATGLKWAKSSNFVGCSVYNSVGQTIANNTATALTFDSEFFDTDTFHSTATNTSRITIPAGLGGKYQINFGYRWAGNATGSTRIARLYLNGANANKDLTDNVATNAEIIQNRSFIYNFTAGDYFEVFVTQNSGGNLVAYCRDYEIGLNIQYLGA
jgi:hypothetical protein